MFRYLPGKSEAAACYPAIFGYNYLYMKVLVSNLSLTAWIVVVAMVFINPSRTIPVHTTGRFDLVLFVLFSAAALVLPWLSMRPRPARQYFTIYFLTFIALMAIAWYAAIAYHRDFFVYGTQLIMVYFIIILLVLDDLNIVRRKHLVYQSFFYAAVVSFVLWIAWLMLMSWAIVSRTEMRWIESTGYNLVNGMLGLALLWAAGLLRDKVNQLLSIRGGTIFLDRRNISDSLSPQENRIIIAFIQADEHTLTCSTLLKALNERDIFGTDCRRCREEQWTASECKAYRNLKNRIADTKKYLELLQIGTLVPVSENPKLIKTTGWRLRFFDDIRLTKPGRLESSQLPHVR